MHGKKPHGLARHATTARGGSGAAAGWRAGLAWLVFVLGCVAHGAAWSEPVGLSWPIQCIPGQTCLGAPGYPDTAGKGVAFNCGLPGYVGHQGTDISVTPAQMAGGVDVLAADDGVVLWVFDGKYDRCPDANEPDCQAPVAPSAPGQSQGYQVCTPAGPYCRNGAGSCYWCFWGGNVVVIRHASGSVAFATRYDHLKRNSISVVPGQQVHRGQVIAQVGSAGHSSGPHLHFEVWGKTYYDPVDPWQGQCNPAPTSPWRDPSTPWSTLSPVRLAQSIAFDALPTALVAGEEGVVAATATSGLPVTFSTVTAGICSVTGNTVVGIGAGACVIAADQAGNASYDPAPRLTGSVAINPAPADCLFDWAERAYPQLFAPTGRVSASFSPYYYRYYPETGNYLASSSADAHVWILGPASGGRLLDAGPIAAFLGASGCR